jgi:cbb3-type cytochrome oxidase maturation protein
MDVIYWLIPSMLVVGVGLVIMLVLATKSGQFDNLESEGTRILFDEEEDLK